MADDKTTKLSIIIRTVDQATAGIKAINARLDAATKPIRNLKEALGDLRSKSGLDDVAAGFKGVGAALGDLLSKVAMVGGVVGLAIASVFHLVSEFDDLGDKAERFGVGVDFLAQMRNAAERAGAPVEALDAGMMSLSENLGQLRAGSGRMKKFLEEVSVPLRDQLKATKSNEEAWDLLANAMAKITDPAKRAALAQKTVGDASLAPMLAKGAAGLKELRDQYRGYGGSMEDAANKAGEVDDSLHTLKAATDGVKASIVSGLSPALKVLVEQLRDWLAGHREEIKEWAAQIGTRLPGAVHAVIDAVSEAVDTVSDFVDQIGGLKTVAIIVGAILLGPLLSAITTLGVAMLTTPFGVFLAGIGIVIAALTHLKEIKDWALGPSLADSLADAQARAKKAGRDDISMEDIMGPMHPVWEQKSDSAKKADASIGDVKQQQQTATATAATTNDQIAKAIELLTLKQTDSKTELKLEIVNAPPGSKITTKPGSNANVDVDIGYQLVHLW